MWTELASSTRSLGVGRALAEVHLEPARHSLAKNLHDARLVRELDVDEAMVSINAAASGAATTAAPESFMVQAWTHSGHKLPLNKNDADSIVLTRWRSTTQTSTPCYSKQHRSGPEPAQASQLEH